ncbi:MAG TPA: GreA/GreB family elongation factor [Candidatus Absconditabacterales bacterium]|nr:GreA/GreB family elongation factor [Candidatus Absconditabacterales bacterium]HRU50377.1 GreA/GreB family elongation factor [Candidatus Absconditabacterales bacterium]
MATKKVNYITKEGYDKLVTELNNYKEVELPAVLERLAEAKTLGDLSENFEYKSAMEDKDFISSKIVELEKLLANVEIIKEEKTNKASDVVDYGSKVVLKIEGDDDTYNVTVGGTGEVGVVGDNDLLISLDSPIGSAIKGHKAGDEVKMRLGNDRKSVKIIKVA